MIMIEDILTGRIEEYSALMLKKLMKRNYENITESIKRNGTYLWGTGKLGEFAARECEKKDISVKGYIDNSPARKIIGGKEVYAPDVLKENDNVIVCSYYFPEIKEQIKQKFSGQINYIYYENWAICNDADNYYMAFKGMLEELCDNIDLYKKLENAFCDHLSREIFNELVMYRMSFDVSYTQDAYRLSCVRGKIDFDNALTKHLSDQYTFYDVGGFDGQSTADYINAVSGYRKIYFFEPDEFWMEKSRNRFADKKDIVYINAVVGNKNGHVLYDNRCGDSANNVSLDGNIKVREVKLDDYIKDEKCYVKIDVEGYEEQVIEGMENAIMKYKPLLSVSLYHRPGDFHKLINKILKLNPDYRMILRHYSNTYADTRCYFIDKSYI